MPHTYAVYHSFTLKRKKLQKNTRFLLDIFVLFPLQSKKKGRRCHVHQVPYSDCSRLHTRRRLPFVHSVSGKNVLPGAFQLRKSGRRHAYFSVFNGVFILPRGLYGGARSPALRAFNGLQVFVLLLRSVHTRKAKGKAAPVPHIIQKLNCIMVPPPMENGRFPYKLYYLGGSIFNLLLAACAAFLAVRFRVVPSRFAQPPEAAFLFFWSALINSSRCARKTTSTTRAAPSWPAKRKKVFHVATQS